jgi:hypothetical protein
MAASESAAAGGGATVFSFAGMSADIEEIGGNLVLSDGAAHPLTHMQEATQAYLKSGAVPPLSQRFLNADKGNEAKATSRWQKTMEWRKANGINTIMRRPHPHFETLKEFFPHFYHLQGKSGSKVYIEKSGAIDLKALKARGLGLDELIYHYMFITEFLWTYLDPSEEGRSVTVLDVKGIGMKDVGGEVIKFIKAASAFCGQHYPERGGHIYIVNVPMWFSGVWKLIKVFLDPVTLAKIHIVRGADKIRTELLMHIDEDQLPQEYGGKSTLALGSAPEENILRELVTKLNADGDGGAGGGAGAAAAVGLVPAAAAE